MGLFLSILMLFEKIDYKPELKYFHKDV